MMRKRPPRKRTCVCVCVCAYTCGFARRGIGLGWRISQVKGQVKSQT
jgi:hypothetical protein